MENTKIDKPTKRTGFFWFGIIAIAGSVISAICMVKHYDHTGFLRDVKIADVAEAVVSISGLLASLAGLFFVLDNLILQRKSLAKQYEAIEHSRQELDLTRQEIAGQTNEFIESNKQYKIQSDTMLLQNNENTFFKLIEIHKGLYAELKNVLFFNNTIDRVTKDAAEYVICYNMGSFRFDQTKLNPRYLTSPDNLHKDVRLEFYVNNVREIIYFIHTKLNNDTFYHNVLYNSLYPDERFLVGMAQKIKLFNFYEDASISGIHYEYSKHYDSLQSYQFYFGYFPMLEIKPWYRNMHVHRSVVTMSSHSFQVRLIENFMSEHKLILVEVRTYIYEKGDTTPYQFFLNEYSKSAGNQHSFKSNTLNKEITDKYFFDYTEILKHMFNLPNSMYEVHYHFDFKYNGRKIEIIHIDTIGLESDGRIRFY